MKNSVRMNKSGTLNRRGGMRLTNVSRVPASLALRKLARLKGTIVTKSHGLKGSSNHSLCLPNGRIAPMPKAPR